jgi:hypothetical protein
MLASMIDTDVRGKLAEYEAVIQMLTAKVEELVAENQRLRSERSDALSVLREVYNDPAASPAHRIKAAGLALPHEVPRLAPVEAPLDLVAEEVVEPLADVVARQRARAEKMLLEPPYRVVDSQKSNGNGNDDSDKD